MAKHAHWEVREHVFVDKAFGRRRRRITPFGDHVDPAWSDAGQPVYAWLADHTVEFRGPGNAFLHDLDAFRNYVGIREFAPSPRCWVPVHACGLLKLFMLKDRYRRHRQPLDLILP